jgi:acid stress-induced BolA-like protein IbaG/YrbA
MDPRDITVLIEQNLAGSTVICAAFAGKRSLQRHQLVYATLGSRVGNEIHALALQTFTPEEWSARGQ